MKNKKSISHTIRDTIANQYEDVPLLFLDPVDYDKAIIGVCDGISVGHNPKVAYDYDKVIEVNMSMGMDIEEAMVYFDYNQESAYVGKHTPVFITSIKKHTKCPI